MVGGICMVSPDFFSSLRWDAGDEGVVIGGNGCMLIEKRFGEAELIAFELFEMGCGGWLMQV
jgi:hypothetical protein